MDYTSASLQEYRKQITACDRKYPAAQVQV